MLESNRLQERTDQIICSFPTGGIEITPERWELILVEHKRLGRMLLERDLKAMFPEAIKAKITHHDQ